MASDQFYNLNEKENAMHDLYLKMRLYFGNVNFISLYVPYRIGEKTYIQTQRK